MLAKKKKNKFLSQLLSYIKRDKLDKRICTLKTYLVGFRNDLLRCTFDRNKSWLIRLCCQRVVMSNWRQSLTPSKSNCNKRNVTTKASAFLPRSSIGEVENFFWPLCSFCSQSLLLHLEPCLARTTKGMEKRRKRRNEMMKRKNVANVRRNLVSFFDIYP